MFERPVTFRHGDGGSSAGRIDCYKRGCFVLEAKKIKVGAGGTAKAGYDDALLRARSQAENYARALPAGEGRPPFLVVVDVGNVIELYAEFTRSGATYVPFPDPRSHRIRLADLRDAGIRARLAAVWNDPLALDPTRHAARVTREIAGHLAALAKLLEEAGHAPESVAGFLTRCLFSMFAEDVGLIPKGSFTELLKGLADEPAQFVPLVGALWREMDGGGFSVVLRKTLPRFNGKLFKNPEVLPLSREQIALLLEAGKADWTQVEPAIFGTLLERALDVHERHALGAHYTPRAYVDRLVQPTVIEPLRRAWAYVQGAAVLLAGEGKQKEAVAELRAFHHRLCSLRVLDPACGSGNFLYVALEHLKRLEGEVLNQLHDIGHVQTLLEAEGLTVDPHQFLGLEINPRAAAIAELVLWIGYLQWHFRTQGSGLPPSPILKDFRNIECRDAVLAWDDVVPVFDDRGLAVSRWDGRSMKTHPVTGEDVPDETARVPLMRYINPRQAEWPAADVVVGNPPFIGASTMRQALGDGYVEALRGAWGSSPSPSGAKAGFREARFAPPEPAGCAKPAVGRGAGQGEGGVPESADFVMFWWHHAAQLVAQGRLSRFGFITTNSLRQTFNRRVVQGALDRGLHLAFAVPDHPWVDNADGAAVRIAMTVAQRATEAWREMTTEDTTEMPLAYFAPGRLLTVTAEREGKGEGLEVELAESHGKIHADLKVGADVTAAQALRANGGISSPGFKLHGAGFIVKPDDAARLEADAPIKDYRNGKDLTDRPRGVKLIDLYGFEADEVRRRWPATYQWVLERVKPERDAKAHTKDGAGYAKLWWLHGKPRSELRKYLAGLPRYIATVETAKHRVFQFLDAAIAPDNRLICHRARRRIFSWRASQAAFMSSGRWPQARRWRTARFTPSSRCFDPFPFPIATPAQQTRIRDLAEQIDAHRKRVLAAHDELTLTGLYNVLQKVGAGDTALTAKEKLIHEKGLVAVLKQLHEELDAAVLDAYGWHDLIGQCADEQTLLERLVALNAERQAEEAQGHHPLAAPSFSGATIGTSRHRAGAGGCGAEESL
jgi:hypothetical protein